VKEKGEDQWVMNILRVALDDPYFKPDEYTPRGSVCASHVRAWQPGDRCSCRTPAISRPRRSKNFQLDRFARTTHCRQREGEGCPPSEGIWIVLMDDEAARLVAVVDFQAVADDERPHLTTIIFLVPMKFGAASW